MAALPYMQLYVADYLADTSHLSTLEHGAYLLLMMNYWQRGKPLPAADEKVARIARLTVEEWLQIKDTILEFFDEKDGLLYQKRIERDLQYVAEKSEQAADAGRVSAAKRWGNGRSTPAITDVITPVERTSNHTDTDTDTEEDIEEKEPATDVADTPNVTPPEEKQLDPRATELANQFASLMELHMPEILARMKNGYLKAWQESIDKLIRIDKRDPEEIAQLITHCFDKDRSWWAATRNIRSPVKFRERNKEGVYYYDVILEEMNHATHQKGSGRNGNRKSNPAPYGDGRPVRYDLIIDTETGEFIDQTRNRACQNRTG